MEEMQATQEELEKKMAEGNILRRDLDARMNALNAASILSEADEFGNITYVNDKFLEVAKYTRDEVMGKPHSILRHPDNPKSLYKEMWDTIKAGKIFQGTYPNKAKDGSDYWVEATLAPVLDENGKAIKYVGVRVDVTETMKQKEAMLVKEAEMTGVVNALNGSYATIEFDPYGNILNANDNFLAAVGYQLSEIKGKHHRMFCDTAYTSTIEYKTFWQELAVGRTQKGEFKRKTKTGDDLWLTAAYTPVLDKDGNVIKVLKIATDVTEALLRNADYKGQLEAIGKSNAVIEFNLDGTVIEANENFLATLGYAASEIKGKHHRMFCEPEYTNSLDYKLFWEKLNKGEYVADTFKRIGKGGKEVFIQASYNPIMDLNGKPFKVVKYATDVTAFTIGFQAATTMINEIKNGNFNAVADTKGIRLEGDVAKVNQDLIGLQTMLKDVINEVNRVVILAGKEGQLRERLNITGLAGSWGELTDSLNELLVSISEPILEINKIVTNLSMGDLTKRFEMSCRGDIKEMGNALNLAIRNINKILKEIEKSSFTVASSSTQMMRKSDSMTKNTTEVSAAIQQMASGAQEQAMRTDESSKLVEGILKSANDMGDKAETINASATLGQQSCLTGLKVIKDVVGSMSDISAAAETTSASVEVLANRSEDISRTLNVITDIASQTNLLALNAAIEAARAGDAGRGFAVVAEEIRKLAEDSRKSAVDIDRVIKDVQKDINSAGKAIDKMRGSVTNGNSASKEAESVFQEINVSSAETLTLSKDILNSSKTTKDAIGTVVKNIEKIVVVSEEVAAGTQEIANSALELNKSMAEVSSTSTNMASVAEELKRGVDQFKLASNV
jgi:methyl-accepting chemotaxis protein